MTYPDIGFPMTRVKSESERIRFLTRGGHVACLGTRYVRVCPYSRRIRVRIVWFQHHDTPLFTQWRFLLGVRFNFFCFSFVCYYSQTSADDVIISQWQAISQLFSPHPPTGKFCTVSEFNYPDKKWLPGIKAYLVKLGLKSFVDGRQDICKDKKI